MYDASAANKRNLVDFTKFLLTGTSIRNDCLDEFESDIKSVGDLLIDEQYF
jgi:hypothetical protein